MTLFEQWRDLMENQTDETFSAFWEEYSGAETRIYSSILEQALSAGTKESGQPAGEDAAGPAATVSGVLGELAAGYDVRPVIFMGFLDGINSSLIGGELDLSGMTEASPVTLCINLEKLYYNMQAAEADYLYGLAQWDGILTEEKRKEITKAYKKSKTVVKGQKIGRNDPCPCGSGKKYKKCCGR